MKSKELLTKEEKEFLKDICKYYDVEIIVFTERTIDFADDVRHLLNMADYPKDMEFKNIKLQKEYKLKELGLD